MQNSFKNKIFSPSFRQLSVLNSLFFLALYFSIPISTLAYTETTSGGQLTAQIYPQDQGAFTPTSINLISYEINLDSSNIIWTINGKKQKEGIGQTELQFTTGDIGKKMLIDTEVVAQDGTDIKKEITIVPAETDILWQSSGYVPPFYKGKSLAAIGDNVTLIAMPNFITENGVKIDTAKLLYKWNLNSVTLSSGYGKNSVVAQINSKIENTVFLEVSNLDNTLRATKLITINPVDPFILFNENNPLLGTTYEKPLLDNFQLLAPEITVKAVPYFINPSNLTHSWLVNGDDVTSSENSLGEITLRQPSGISGKSTVAISVDTPFQSIQKSVTINFGSTNLRF